MTETPETPARQKPSAAKLAGIAAACAFGVYVLFNVGHSDADAGNTHEGIDRGSAWNSCKAEVKDHLRNPDSADFALLSTDFSEAGKGWSITGTLKAQNDYGVVDEIAYACTVQEDGTTTAHVRP